MRRCLCFLQCALVFAVLVGSTRAGGPPPGQWHFHAAAQCMQLLCRWKFCGGGCWDTTSDKMNCGTCSFMCSAAESCVGGICMCSPGKDSMGLVKQAVLWAVRYCDTSSPCPAILDKTHTSGSWLLLPSAARNPVILLFMQDIPNAAQNVCI